MQTIKSPSFHVDIAISAKWGRYYGNMFLRLFLKYWLLLICCLTIKSVAQSVNGMKQRVIMTRTLQDVFQRGFLSTDSVVYVYSGKRGSNFTPYLFHPRRSAGFKNYFTPLIDPSASLQPPFADINDLEVAYDSCYEFSDVMGGLVYQHNIRSIINRKYDPQGNMETFSFEYSIASSPPKYHIYRNAYGQPTTIFYIYAKTTGTGNDTPAVKSISYTADGYVTADTMKYSNTAIRNVAQAYTYDRSGNVETIIRTEKSSANQWTPTSMETYGYNNAGYPVTYRQQLYNPGTQQWQPEYEKDLSYDDKDRLISLKTFPMHPRLNSTYGESFTMHYNDAGYVDTLITYYPYDVVDKTTFFYNEFGNPDSAITFRSTDTGKAFQYYTLTLYGYELYEDNVILIPKGNIILYPNPTNSKLTIRWNERKPGGPVNAIFYSSGGQRVRDIAIPKIEPENTIDLQGLSSGVYYMQIITEGGGKLHTGTIVINNNGS
ncbi:MAG: T9SS type A sorting domain-containing protein [Sphingobacteriales bacterium]|nr:MAG: T9SS type A sorting domain-containing protein [Sphingobacteriales bacterium]